MLGLPVGMIASAVAFVAVVVLLAALGTAAVQYWPVTLAVVGFIVLMVYAKGKAKERRNRV